jgi:peroxiredoxin Q/BCP
MPAIANGTAAPDFELPDQHGNLVRLSQYRGKSAVVVYFYPKDDTTGCTIEACRFRDDFEKFRMTGTEVIGISDDSTESHGHFASKYHLPFKLLRSCLEITLPNVKSFWEGFRSSILHGTDLCED